MAAAATPLPDTPAYSVPSAPVPPARPRKRRWLRWLGRGALACVLLAVLLVAALWWWAGTAGSLATALGWASDRLPLRTEGVRGSLRAQGHIERIEWKQDGLAVQADAVDLAWQPWALLGGTLRLDHLRIGKLEVTDQRAPRVEPSAPPTALDLPLMVSIDDVAITLFDWHARTTHVAASLISGNYAFIGQQHALTLVGADFANGHYSGKARLEARLPITLEAQLSGQLLAPSAPGQTTAPLPLLLQASVQGPLETLQVQATVQTEALPTDKDLPPKQRLAPTAQLNATLTPWLSPGLRQAEATFAQLDLAALWPNAPRTELTGQAAIAPKTSPDAGADATAVWQINAQVRNSVAGPWDQQQLPLDSLQAKGQWSDGRALIEDLQAQLGQGRVVVTGEWQAATAPQTAAIAPALAASAPATPSAEALAPAPPTAPWQLQATLQGINPAQLHTRFAALPLDGSAKVNSQGARIDFDAQLKAQANAKAQRPPTTVAPTGQPAKGAIRLSDAAVTGSWLQQPTGDTLDLTTLRVRSDEAELKGQLQVQPSTRGGQGQLQLKAPGFSASVSGELREQRGKGEFQVQGSDAAQTLRWLQKLPGLIPPNLQNATAQGAGSLTGSWQGGWQDPQLQAKLSVPSLDWRAGKRAAVTAKVSAPSTTALPTAAAPSDTVAPAPVLAVTTPPEATDLLKIRGLQADLSGRLSQAQLSVQGGLDTASQRWQVALKAQGGQQKTTAWAGLLQQLQISVEDLALGAGRWQVSTQDAVRWRWTPAQNGAVSGAFESGAGQALLQAPVKSSASSTPSSAVIAWQPVRWNSSELSTSGELRGLPLAWIELLAGPQMANAGLTGDMLFNGSWDAQLGQTLRLKASLMRSSGDVTVQGEGLQGKSARVAAGVKDARITLTSQGEQVMVALLWNSERAGSAQGQLTSRLARKAAGSGGWTWPANAPLNGELKAQLPRIGVWSVLAPPGWRLRGSLGADIAISGTRAAPLLKGSLQANDLALRSVVDGIEFGNGRLRAQLEGDRLRIQEFTLQGAGPAGAGGSLTAQGQAGWINGQPEVQLSAQLKQLRASIRTDRQLTVSGKVEANMRQGQATLGGQLLVDQARIVLPDEGTPRLGDDVRVRTASGSAVGEKAPEQTSDALASTAAQSKGPQLQLAVNIDLGPDFRVQGKGIDTRLRGTLALTGSSLQEPRLVGTVRTVSGQYRAYGQRLDVEQGVVRFTGSITNPSLDILAIRPNLSQRVGVQITGTALLPFVRLYAQPDLPDAEKLSWLVIGRPAAAGGAEAALLQQAALALLGSKSGAMSGGLAASLGLDELSFRGASNGADGSTSEGAVTLGKRFSSNFYAAYERSLSGAMGTLFVFYDLSKRFTIRAEAGEQNAIDLIFTLSYN